MKYQYIFLSYCKSFEEKQKNNIVMQFSFPQIQQYILNITSYQDSPFPFKLITASSSSTNSPAQMGGYLLARGDSAKWPRGFNTASDAMWANNYA